MKKLLSILAVTVAFMTLGLSASTKSGGAAVNFAEKSHDFGTIQESNGPVACEFEFTNDGDAPLVILSASASCGCTRPEYPKQPIQPGKSAKIKVNYNPAGRPGEFVKDVKLKTNDRENRNVTLKITGTVIPKK